MRDEREYPNNDGVSRRTFLHGVVASAATSVVGLPAPARAAATPQRVATALTESQTCVLTTVLDRLVPADGAMPGAGSLGIASVIDQALGVAPHLRRHFMALLSALPPDDEIASLSGDSLDQRLKELQDAQPDAFDLLLQATYTGYYSHPTVLQALGGVPSDREGELNLDRFDPAELEKLRRQTAGA